jgi:hypothetical protein
MLRLGALEPEKERAHLVILEKDRCAQNIETKKCCWHLLRLSKSVASMIMKMNNDGGFTNIRK